MVLNRHKMNALFTELNGTPVNVVNKFTKAIKKRNFARTTSKKICPAYTKGVHVLQCFALALCPSKVLSETKMTKLGVGRFRSISGHFSANYINSFHKTEFLKVILMGQTY